MCIFYTITAQITSFCGLHRRGSFINAGEKIFSKILNVLLTIILLALAILIYNYVQITVLKKDYTNIFGYTAFQVVSGSMEETIKVGDIIIAKLKYNQPLKHGDIIVFKQDENIITHRIIEMGDGKIITKGDANNTTDNPITRSEVIGKVIKIIPNIAIWKKVFTSPKVIISVITTIIFFGIAFSFKEKNQCKEKEEDKDNV